MPCCSQWSTVFVIFIQHCFVLLPHFFQLYCSCSKYRGQALYMLLYGLFSKCLKSSKKENTVVEKQVVNVNKIDFVHSSETGELLNILLLE